MQAVSINERRAKEVVRAGGTGWRYDYIGSPGVIDANPQAFLVDRLYSGARIDPHFHDIDQFQVVVGGYCRMGKKEAKPVTYQYADAYTPYGPIVGNEQGFAFFTLRPIASGGFFAMPGNRHNMPCRAGRNLAGRFDLEAARPRDGECIQEDLMAPQDDGVDATGYRFGAGASISGPPSDAGGQYFLVCDGEVRCAGKSLSEGSLVHVAPGESALDLVGGQNGANVLMLQFARPSERPGSNPAQLAQRDPNAYMQRPANSGS
jgi:hypothetical protein